MSSLLSGILMIKKTYEGGRVTNLTSQCGLGQKINEPTPILNDW